MDTNVLAVLLKVMANQASQQPVNPGNTLAVVSLIMSAIGPLIAAFAAYWSAKAVRNTEETKKETVTLKEHINSRMDELQDQTKKASFAEGAASSTPSLPVVPGNLERLLQEILDRTPKLSP